MSTPLRVLIVEDSDDDTQLVLRELRRGGFAPTWERVETAEAMEAALKEGEWDLILSDYVLPRFDGLQALKLAQESGLDLPFVIVSGTIGEEIAIRAMKAGAHDYLLKESLERLGAAIEREVRESRIRTEHRKMEQQLRQSQKLEAIGLLAGGVAHDFNNLLMVILGHCELMERALKDGDPLTEDVAQIKACGERATALTRQLLAFSRKQALQPEALNLNDVVAGLEEMLQRLIGEDVELICMLADDLGSVEVDAGQIEQVIMNLAVNARDAMPDGGKLTIETANVHLDEEYARARVSITPGPHVLLAVTDTGSGMDARTLSQIFEPFFTTKEMGRGTGLGLSTAYGIVKQSGGNIWVYSEPGEGTVFKIYLPRQKGPPVSRARPETRARGGRGEQVLVVEDDSALRGLFARMLEDLGYRATVAANGGEALILVEEQELTPDLLITDVVMPGMSGVGLVERLHRNQPDLRVLYMSGYTDNAIVRHGGLDPGTPFLQKPFSADDLAAKIREILDA